MELPIEGLRSVFTFGGGDRAATGEFFWEAARSLGLPSSSTGRSAEGRKVKMPSGNSTLNQVAGCTATRTKVNEFHTMESK